MLPLSSLKHIAFPADRTINILYNINILSYEDRKKKYNYSFDLNYIFSISKQSNSKIIITVDICKIVFRLLFLLSLVIW